MTTVAVFLAGLHETSFNTMRQRLREVLYDAPDKRGQHRRALDETQCFAPLLGWILAWWQGEPRLALAIDATNLGQRFTVLCLSVVYRGCALPVAWTVLPGSTKGRWLPPIKRLLRLLRAVIPADWTVIVLTDRGLYSKDLYRAIQRNRWQPMMRVTGKGNFRPAGDSRFRPLADLLPYANTLWYGPVTCFSTADAQLECTLLAYWQDGCDTPWLLLTDLPSADADPLWYGMRMWIEHGFKDDKRGGFRWEQTKMTDPQRASRLWLVLALAHLWTISVGGEIEVEEHRLPDPIFAPYSLPAPHRTLSCLNRGWLEIVIALVAHRPVPVGRFISEPWPTLPFARPILDLLVPGGHFVPFKTYP